MADLSVDLSSLAATALSLSDLMGQFSQAEDIVKKNEVYVGHEGLKKALEDFAGDWKTHAEVLVKSMDSVYKMADSAVKAYTDADGKLKASLTGDGHKVDHTQIGKGR